MNQPGKHSILKTINLDIGYSNKTGKTIITEAINIEVNEGELVAVIGVNGVGKSTFLRTLSGVQDALKGKVLVKNEQIQQIDSLELASLVSLVLTEQPISKNLSVFELVA